MKCRKIAAVSLVLAIIIALGSTPMTGIAPVSLAAPPPVAASPDHETVWLAMDALPGAYPDSTQLPGLVTMAKEWIENDAALVTPELDAAMASTITGKIADIQAIAPAGTNMSGLSDAQILLIAGYLGEAVSAVPGFSFSSDITTMTFSLLEGSTIRYTITFRPQTGSNPPAGATPIPVSAGSSRSSRSSSGSSNPGVTVATDNPIKQTGTDTNIAGLIAVALVAVPLPVLAFAICLFKKRKEFHR